MGRQFWKPGNMLYPLPTVMVSCQKKGERPNIITLAWVGTICSDPAMVSISVRPERYSHDIIAKSGEFVINLVNEETARAMDWCGVKSGRDFDKFKEMNLTPFESKTVAVPGILECPVSIECKVKDMLKLGSHDMFLGEVTAVSVDDKYLEKDGKFNMADLNLVAYNHGEYNVLGNFVGKFGYSVEGTSRKR